MLARHLLDRLSVERGRVFIDGHGRKNQAAVAGKTVRMALDRGALAGMSQVLAAKKIAISPHCRQQLALDRLRPLGDESRRAIALRWAQVASLARGLIDHAVELVDGCLDTCLLTPKTRVALPP